VNEKELEHLERFARKFKQLGFELGIQYYSVYEAI
jgi:hypothetical protein